MYFNLISLGTYYKIDVKILFNCVTKKYRIYAGNTDFIDLLVNDIIPLSLGGVVYLIQIKAGVFEVKTFTD